ncbi:MAG: hypothetical protein LC105_08855 [Chitinophagales bacterium]|nr:hypothetical protein [Chitinophagales bacterium]MCZ2393950.1 hypothetical protein [Chitinophagales bacterium]
MISKKELENIIINSLKKLQENDILFLDQKYNIHERTVTHKLAMYIESYLKEKYDYDVDVEYNRMSNGNDVGDAVAKIIDYANSEEGPSFVYPDIIIHKRNTEINIAVIEVKMNWKNRKKFIDFDKIEAYVNQLNYKYGIFIEVGKYINVEFYPFK